jgi:hypothetical protein
LKNDRKNIGVFAVMDKESEDLSLEAAIKGNETLYPGKITGQNYMAEFEKFC